MRRENEKINNIRAIAILMVVFGHSIIIYSNNWNLYTTSQEAPILNFIKELINLIQMPLFFSVSGYLFYYSMKKIRFIELFVKKIRRLIVPYIFIALFWLFPIRYILKWTGYMNKSIVDIFIFDIFLGKDNGHLWYLQVLFIIFIFGFLFITIMNKCITNVKFRNMCFIFISYIISYFSFLIPTYNGIDMFRMAAYNWIWFAIGYVLCQYDLDAKNIIRYKGIFVLLAILISALTVTNIFPYKRLSSLVLVIICYILISNRKNKYLNILSQYSFGIYLFHSPLIYFTFNYLSECSPIVVVFINFVIFGGIAMGITYLLKNTKFKFLIGE